MRDNEARPELWICPIDKEGKPVDSALIQIAKRVWPTVLAIGRERRMNDASFLSDVVEKVVHAASRRLSKSREVSIETEYILASCKYEMNRFAKRQRRLDQRSCEEFDAQIDGRSIGWEESLHRGLLIDQLLSMMDQKQKNLILLRLDGERWKYIASTLGMSVGSARVQFSKTLKVLRDIVNNRDPRSKPDQDSHDD